MNYALLKFVDVNRVSVFAIYLFVAYSYCGALTKFN